MILGQGLSGQAVVPDDGADLGAKYLNGFLYVGVTGDVTVTLTGGDTVTFTAVPAGALLPIQVKRVWSTGTTATNILVLN